MMTTEQRDKYAYELMVKNNPEEAVKQLLLKDKIIEETQQNYTDEYNLRHKLSFELSEKNDEVSELSSHLALYSSEKTMLKEIERLNNIIDEIKNMCKEEYYERNTTDIDSIGLSNNIWVMIYMKINELRGKKL